MKALIFLLFFATAHGSDEIPDTDMHAMTKEVMALQRVMFSHADFGNPGNEETISTSFDVLKKHLKRLEERVFPGQPALRGHVSFASQQIQDADRAFRIGDKAYSRYMLRSSLQTCIACHTRTASPDFVLTTEELKGASPRERAEFFFATRQFEKGHDAYEKILSEEGRGLSQQDFRNIALPLLVYYARVKEDPSGGAEFFQNLVKAGRAPRASRGEVEAWIREFAQWKKAGVEQKVSLNERELVEQGKALLKGSGGKATGRFDIRGLRASSSFHAALESSDKKTPAKAEALLHLGQIYDQLAYPLAFQYGQLYWKACITDYPKQVSAQMCYRRLRSSVLKMAGAGSSKSTPTANEVELAKWKKLAF